jgi:hypothetical protein
LKGFRQWTRIKFCIWLMRSSSFLLIAMTGYPSTRSDKPPSPSAGESTFEAAKSFGRSLNDLGIEIMCANTPGDKGPERLGAMLEVPYPALPCPGVVICVSDRTSRGR